MRIRTIKPEFWTNEKLAALPDRARLVAIGLLNYADDDGYFWANPLPLRGALFPFDEDSSRLRRSLAQLAEKGYIRLGEASDGRECGQIVNFSKHQRIDRPKSSEIKALARFDDESTTNRRTIDDESLLEWKGMEGNGMDGKGIGAPSADAAPADLNPLQDEPTPTAAITPRPRDPNFDALAACDGSVPTELTRAAARACGIAMSEIRKVAPDVTPAEISRRAENYRWHMPDCTITPSALAKHWAKCGKSPSGRGNYEPGFEDDGTPRF